MIAKMGQAGKPTLRAAALTGFTLLSRNYGINTGELLREAGFPRDIESDPDRRIEVEAVCRLYESAAIATGADDFALRLSDMRGFANLGPVSLVARDEPTVRSSMSVFIKYLPLHNDALFVRLEEQAGIASLFCYLSCPGPKTQATDIAVGTLFRILRQLLGPDWRPELVSLERKSPVDPGFHRNFFGSRVAFEQEVSAIVLESRLLDQPNPMANEALRPYATSLLKSFDTAHSTTMADRAKRVIETLLSNRRCTAAFVASRLGISRRTLNRRLEAEGTSFLELLNSVRKDIASRQVANTQRSFAEIADLLGFGSASAFSTWFRGQFDITPRQFRAG